MKKLLGIIFLLFIIYLGGQILIKYFAGDYNIEYIIKKENYEFEIKENYELKLKESEYYFEIKKDNYMFNFTVPDHFKKGSKIINDIKYLKTDKYLCIYPIFKNKDNKTDVLCSTGNNVISYSVLKNKDKKIDDFVLSLSKEGYYKENKIFKTFKELTIYNNIKRNNDYILLWNKNGFNVINKSIRRFTSLENDKDNKLTYLIDNLYCVFNYKYKKNKEYSSINVIDIESSGRATINLPATISEDSYYQGDLKGKLYLIDKKNYKQWEFNPEKRKFTVIGNRIKGYYSYTGENFELRDFSEILKTNKIHINKYKIPDILKNKGYDVIEKVSRESNSIYYLQRKNKNKTDIYKVSENNLNIITHILSIDNLKEISYKDDRVYYIVGNKVYSYSDTYSLEKIIENKESNFTNTNSLDVY